MIRFKIGDRVVCNRMERPPEGIDLQKSYCITALVFDDDGEAVKRIQLDNGHVYDCVQDFRVTHELAIGDEGFTPDPVAKPEHKPREDKKPKVSLIDFTGAGSSHPADYALAVLLFAKDTRLEMTPDGFWNKLNMPYEKKLEQLAYVVNTIPSSWEFVDLTFMIRDVTRAFTHQLVRTRLASYAQQTMRTLDVTGWDYATGPTIKADEEREELYDDVMDSIKQGYASLIGRGVKPEDARGVLPTNILTNICMKLNLRVFVDMCKKRSSLRVQDEYRHVVELMKAEALRAYPWLQLFLDRGADKAMIDLENLLSSALPEPQRTDALKMLMQVRGY